MSRFASTLVFCLILANSARLILAAGDQPHVYFSKIGRTTHVLEYVNLKLVIDLAGTKDLLSALLRAMKDRQERLRHSDSPAHFIEHHRLKIVRLEDLLDECETYSALKDTVDVDAADQHRDRRFIFTLIAVLAAAAVTAFGAYTVAEIISLNAKTRSISDATEQIIGLQQDFGSEELNLEGHVKRTIAMADDLATSVSNLAYIQQAEHTVGVLERKLSTIREIITAAMYQRLAPAAMQQQQYKRFLVALQQESFHRGFQLLISRTSDLLQCATSFVMTDTGINIITHIPSSPVEAILDMYSFIPLPIPVHNEYHALLDISDTVLAIAPSGVIFRTLSAFDLSQCSQLGEYFICHNGNVMRKALPAMQDVIRDNGVCMYALFSQNFDVAARACNVLIMPAQTAVLQLSPHTFATYAERDFLGTVQCTGAAASNISAIKFRAKQIRPVSLAPGCIVDSDRHVFSAGDRARTRTWSVNITIPLEKMQLTQDLNFTSFHQFRRHADFTLQNKTHFELPTALAHWKQWLHQQESSSSLDFLVPSHPWVSFFIIGIGLLQILLICYVRHLHLRFLKVERTGSPGPNLSVMAVNNADTANSAPPSFAQATAPPDMTLSRHLFPSFRKVP